jgi:hypothetical protein
MSPSLFPASDNLRRQARCRLCPGLLFYGHTSCLDTYDRLPASEANPIRSDPSWVEWSRRIPTTAAKEAAAETAITFRSACTHSTYVLPCVERGIDAFYPEALMQRTSSSAPRRYVGRRGRGVSRVRITRARLV